MDGEVKGQIVKIIQAFVLVKESKVLEYLDDKQLLKVLLYCEARGWLHYKYEGKKMVFVGCGYNIPKFDEKTCHILPVKSEGEVLYVPFIVSIAQDNTLPKQAISEYLKEHPETRTVVYYKDDAKVPTIFNRKGASNGKREESRATASTCVSS